VTVLSQIQRRSLPQRRKGAKRYRVLKNFLCAFASLRENIPFGVLLVCFAFVFVGESAAQDSLEVRQSRGRQIYIQGTSRSGKDILAYIGDGSLEVPGSSMPCASCHGLDGRGKQEGGISPSNLTWEFLSKPYGLKHADGRQHPPYTERALELAITRGLDPAGNKLLNVMPRYVMSAADMSDLVSYLQLLGKEREPGVSENKIVIGTLVPAAGSLVELGRVVTAVTNAVFAELNSQNGIYGRRLELEVIETAETPAATRAKLEVLLKDRHLFALTGAVIAGLEKEVVPLLGQQETPLIGPLTLYPQTDFPLNRQVFYLLSGLDGQARSLIKFAAKKPELKSSRLAVILPRNDITAAVVEALKDQRKKENTSSPQVVEYANGRFDVADVIKQVRQASAEVVFFLGNTDEALSFLREAEKLSWFPAMLVTGATIGTGIFAAPLGFDGKVFFSFPTSPADQTADGLREFRALAEKYRLPSNNLAAQLSAYSAAKILVEAVKRAGKEVSRERLIQVLEGFYDYSTGLTPAISYGPNRRVGAAGAYVVTIDLKEKKFVPASGWVDNN
jgi:ABC-type branched-subunit amino acid transport system substrate-binding protein